MREIKFRGKAINDTHWMFVTPDSGSWEQFWLITRKETRGQFTGLRDRSGKEIYEGDILRVDWRDSRYPIHLIGPVTWDTEEAGWMLGEGGSPKHDAEYFMEVVGNVFENAELLKPV